MVIHGKMATIMHEAYLAEESGDLSRLGGIHSVKSIVSESVSQPPCRFSPTLFGLCYANIGKVSLLGTRLVISFFNR
ncbi:hypothetical protein DPMN_043321 [Dreissena polymorpha]|uniref:Uncharacterized protein n=1 Tax=Dreissena polymorpha TaxID=45954 RepID=A0A9D4HXU3_DREPO|nr:hypothetical protein DPMN_043321 [Dreissena polymorpha]